MRIITKLISYIGRVGRTMGRILYNIKTTMWILYCRYAIKYIFIISCAVVQDGGEHIVAPIYHIIYAWYTDELLF
jgi:hypothetical protein